MRNINILEQINAARSAVSTSHVVGERQEDATIEVLRNEHLDCETSKTRSLRLLSGVTSIQGRVKVVRYTPQRSSPIE